MYGHIFHIPFTCLTIECTFVTKVEGLDTLKLLYEVFKNVGGEISRRFGIFEGSWGFFGILSNDSESFFLGFCRVRTMGCLGILWNSAGILRGSWGFSRFLQKVYQVSEVSNP